MFICYEYTCTDNFIGRLSDCKTPVGNKACTTIYRADEIQKELFKTVVAGLICDFKNIAPFSSLKSYFGLINEAKTC